ncbi:hypothetical protein CHS0354_037957 [Potamilus streckersoni]|uniref:Uncharacterized protein n=1 Tax=Potamilus streckersoni TaxID=2493646 RepID=A0AAE0TAG7_9BIVA|nr:hypothetical protein CHS0354_037957 [Potamilus streckersoni]
MIQDYCWIMLLLGRISLPLVDTVWVRKITSISETGHNIIIVTFDPNSNVIFVFSTSLLSCLFKIAVVELVNIVNPFFFFSVTVTFTFNMSQDQNLSCICYMQCKLDAETCSFFCHSYLIPKIFRCLPCLANICNMVVMLLCITVTLFVTN